MRSELGQVRGLGPARSGVAHWWAQRLTALALLPLTLWFILAIISLSGAPHEVVLDWTGRPLTVVLLICLVLATFYHMQLGLQVVIEDYIHVERTKLLAIVAMKAATFLLGLSALVAVLKLGI
jgi:succinate dehydrogenase / fumarate reductase membrane anchor subunit